VKDLGQLLYSSEVIGVDDRDRQFFWRAYLGRGRRDWMTRGLLWAVLFRGRRYRRQNARRKSRASIVADRRVQAA
jgi:hypothetical protein